MKAQGHKKGYTPHWMTVGVRSAGHKDGGVLILTLTSMDLTPLRLGQILAVDSAENKVLYCRLVFERDTIGNST